MRETYIFDTEEKKLSQAYKKSSAEPWETERLSSMWNSMDLFRHRLCELSPRNDSPGEDLVEIARSKFKEAEGARERPDAIEYLSVHCDMSLLILGSPSEAQKVPVRGFHQTANTAWNSLCDRWLPDFAWRPVRGGLSGNEDFQKALAEILLDKSPLIEMLVQGELGRNNAGRRAGRRLPRRRVPRD